MNNIGIGIVRGEAKASAFLMNLYDQCSGRVSRLAISELVRAVGASHTEESIGSHVQVFIRKQVNIINVKASRVNKDTA